MSEILMYRAHVDTLLTAGVQWNTQDFMEFKFREQWHPDGTESGPLLPLRAEHAHVLGRIVWLVHMEYCDWWVTFGDEGDEGVPSRAEVEGYAFDPLPGQPDPGVVLKAIDFYEYQIAPDDHEESRRTTVGSFLHFLRLAAISRVPGYERAPWGIQNRDVFLNAASFRER
ncbi:hypothetical protein [Actinocorallia aurantiaca]|uniref:Uncharacterized protein n=1 Tax=Actinocorallia aurantiaca TaxID=46204 RepID=A0ABP6GPV5_9ACTN